MARRSGFTLIELTVAIAVVGLVVASFAAVVVLPLLCRVPDTPSVATQEASDTLVPLEQHPPLLQLPLLAVQTLRNVPSTWPPEL